MKHLIIDWESADFSHRYRYVQQAILFASVQFYSKGIAGKYDEVFANPSSSNKERDVWQKEFNTVLKYWRIAEKIHSEEELAIVAERIASLSKDEYEAAIQVEVARLHRFMK